MLPQILAFAGNSLHPCPQVRDQPTSECIASLGKYLFRSGLLGRGLWFSARSNKDIIGDSTRFLTPIVQCTSSPGWPPRVAANSLPPLRNKTTSGFRSVTSSMKRATMFHNRTPGSARLMLTLRADWVRRQRSNTEGISPRP
jgi:hypothetical protein